MESGDFGERAHKHRLAQPGYALQQNVTADEKGGQNSLQDVTLSYDALLEFGFETAKELAELNGIGFGGGHSVRITWV